ncbi:MAG: TonB family protein [Bacteroidales bacterium]|nr:TonB family protein [Bacteroidales bacterium]
MKRLLMFLAFVLAASIIHAQDNTAVDSLMAGETRTLYQILGVKKKALPEKMWPAYVRQLKKYHPSKTEGDKEKLLEMGKIAFAYNVLSRKNLKALYDAKGLDGIKNKVHPLKIMVPIMSKSGSVVDGYLYRSFNKYLKYPSSERKAGHQGMVTLSCVMGADNRLRDIKVVKSSGYPVLDSAAVQAAEKAGRNPLKRVVPAYSLEDGQPCDAICYISLPFYSNGSKMRPNPQYYRSSSNPVYRANNIYRQSNVNNGGYGFQFRLEVNPSVRIMAGSPKTKESTNGPDKGGL